jgi:hypothetical protein
MTKRNAKSGGGIRSKRNAKAVVETIIDTVASAILGEEAVVKTDAPATPPVVTVDDKQPELLFGEEELIKELGQALDQFLASDQQAENKTQLVAYEVFKHRELLIKHGGNQSQVPEWSVYYDANKNELSEQGRTWRNDLCLKMIGKCEIYDREARSAAQVERIRDWKKKDACLRLACMLATVLGVKGCSSEQFDVALGVFVVPSHVFASIVPSIPGAPWMFFPSDPGLVAINGKGFILGRDQDVATAAKVGAGHNGTFSVATLTDSQAVKERKRNSRKTKTPVPVTPPANGETAAQTEIGASTDGNGANDRDETQLSPKVIEQALDHADYVRLIDHTYDRLSTVEGDTAVLGWDDFAEAQDTWRKFTRIKDIWVRIDNERKNKMALAPKTTRKVA